MRNSADVVIPFMTMVVGTIGLLFAIVVLGGEAWFGRVLAASIAGLVVGAVGLVLALLKVGIRKDVVADSELDEDQ